MTWKNHYTRCGLRSFQEENNGSMSQGIKIKTFHQNKLCKPRSGDKLPVLKKRKQSSMLIIVKGEETENIDEE